MKKIFILIVFTILCNIVYTQENDVQLFYATFDCDLLSLDVSNKVSYGYRFGNSSGFNKNKHRAEFLEALNLGVSFHHRIAYQFRLNYGLSVSNVFLHFFHIAGLEADSYRIRPAGVEIPVTITAIFPFNDSKFSGQTRKIEGIAILVDLGLYLGVDNKILGYERSFTNLGGIFKIKCGMMNQGINVGLTLRQDITPFAYGPVYKYDAGKIAFIEDFRRTRISASFTFNLFKIFSKKPYLRGPQS